MVRGSVNAMPFADRSFDAAIAADVLCHAAVDPATALIEIRRVLRPGGRLVVNMPAYAWLMSAHDRRVHNARRQTAGELRRRWRRPASFGDQRRLLERAAVAVDDRRAQAVRTGKIRRLGRRGIFAVA